MSIPCYVLISNPQTLVATEAKQPDGSVLASLSASEPGRYVLHVKNGDKITAYAFNVKKADSGIDFDYMI